MYVLSLHTPHVYSNFELLSRLLLIMEFYANADETWECQSVQEFKRQTYIQLHAYITQTLLIKQAGNVISHSVSLCVFVCFIFSVTGIKNNIFRVYNKLNILHTSNDKLSCSQFHSNSLNNNICSELFNHVMKIKVTAAPERRRHAI